MNTFFSEPELPREKLISKGVQSLKDEELLAIIFGTGYKGTHVLKLAKGFLRAYPKEKLASIDFETVSGVKGIGATKACSLLAGIELARRVMESSNYTPTILSSSDIASVVNDLRDKKKEYFVALYLNARSQLISKEVISVGTINASIVHPREVFYPAIKNLATSVAFAHNHPSGDTNPSPEDFNLTTRLVYSGKILDIEIIDHVIVSNGSTYSFRDNKVI